MTDEENGDWDIPALDFGGPVSDDDIRQAVRAAVCSEHDRNGDDGGHTFGDD